MGSPLFVSTDRMERTVSKQTKPASAPAAPEQTKPASAVEPVFARAFPGVVAGDLYPTEFEPGEDCPPELIEAATEAKALKGSF